MATDPEIRLATRSDADEIARLSRIMIEHGVGWSYTPVRINRAIAHKSRNVIVACFDQQLVGFAIMSYKKQNANLDLLGVRSKYRRRGIGRSLVGWLEKSAATAGIVHHHIQVRKSNQAAISCYSTLGYHIVNEIEGYYAGQETAVVMYKYTADTTITPDVDLSRFLNQRGGSASRY